VFSTQEFITQHLAFAESEKGKICLVIAAAYKLNAEQIVFGHLGTTLALTFL
jgi:hypothetical protein